MNSECGTSTGASGQIPHPQTEARGSARFCCQGSEDEYLGRNPAGHPGIGPTPGARDHAHEHPRPLHPMKLIILAAGYATRLYPLTLTQPKPLLRSQAKPILAHVLQHLRQTPELSSVTIISNHRFYDHFHVWAQHQQSIDPALPIKVINDGSTDASNRLGAIGDLVFAIEKQSIDEDIMVVAGDNLFSQDIQDFGAFCLGEENTGAGRS